MKGKIILFLVCMMTLIGCGNTKRLPQNQDVVYGSVMTAQIDTFSRVQLDSMCRVDGISNNLDEDWLCSTINDYTTKTGKVKYVFIKSATKNNELIYTVYPYKGTLYIVNKRRTE